MLRTIFPVAAALLLAGCTTYKVWTESDADRDIGMVQLSYEYRKFESPVVDERAGTSMARERCRDWGFVDAQRKSEDRQCVDGVESSCSKWRVARNYQCLREPVR